MSTPRSRPDSHAFGGSAVAAQWFLIIFFVVFFVPLIYAMLQLHSIAGTAICASMILVLILIVRLALLTADIQVNAGTITISKAFGSRKICVSEYQSIDQALWPFCYCIKFKDGSRAFFSLLPWEIAKKFLLFSASDDYLIKVRIWLKEEQDKWADAARIQNQ